MTFGESSWCSASLALQVPHTWLTAVQPPDEVPAYSPRSADMLLGKKITACHSGPVALCPPSSKHRCSRARFLTCQSQRVASAYLLQPRGCRSALTQRSSANTGAGTPHTPVKSESQAWEGFSPPKSVSCWGILSLSSGGFFGVVFYSSLVLNSLGLVRNSFLLFCGFHLLTSP